MRLEPGHAEYLSLVLVHNPDSPRRPKWTCISHLPILGSHVPIAVGWARYHATKQGTDILLVHLQMNPSKFQAFPLLRSQNSHNMPQSVRDIVSSLSLENTALACKAAQKSLGLNLVDTVPLNQTEEEANW